ncbi:NAD-dependent epimerase/dehydratase family protein [Paenibacillus sp. JCM 10914]|uniref:NAD-dependent epimerase/dehydratase family protein n=1 Tax=Paenibacillus sp. JCM 10914 TaxID=1236974 RepID=UPI0003CC80BB|nr:NAD-dependent epimerase/dehydratase family protein [Paenibacillus sp. JCM 10914]GAE05471.1 UDP-glucose 4-epimerase [Paenibacillus sp. JCM 10914]
MKMVVTGGAGFIGSHLVNGLINQGYEVHVIDNLTTGDPGRLHNEAILHVTDINSPQTSANISMLKPDVVFHLAAQAEVQLSIKEPRKDVDANVMGTLNILEACRKTGVRKLIFASTSGVYGNLEKPELTESDPVDPISFYALSKWAAERYIQMYQRLFGLSYTILRYGNVYGPEQTAKGEGGVVAILGKKLQEGASFQIFGDGTQTRDFIYVKDVVEANIASIHNGDQEVLHVSTGRSQSINTLVQLVRQEHAEEIMVEYMPAKNGDILHSCLNNGKTRSILPWVPTYTLEEGVAQTYRHWMREV